ncbi:MAG: hypothetical protein Q7V10_05855 [Methanobacteriaceae archaeon]|nr:hypothetical protein [Methanobacteriaceae archaeon]MDO9627814.1 hypothetical protein [Methanobacteriaceae archaeon]
MKIYNILLLISIFVVLNMGCVFAAGPDTNYTNDSDFDKGDLTGLEYNSTHNQLQLSNSSSSVNPFIWVPNSNEGTVSKINTITGMEVARYKTSNLTYSNPSRTTVDLDGNCWVGNRNIGTVVKIGLLESGQWIDRNHNGVADTCRDVDGNGVINSTEILPWGADECVLWEVILIPGSEGNFVPGKYNGSYVNDYYNPGPRGLAIDSKNNLWVGTYGTMKYYYLNGSDGQILKTIDVSSVGHTPYGAVIDQNGILWSSGNTGNNVLRLDPSNNTFTRINLPHKSYGLALDRNNHLFVSGLDHYRITCINVLNGTILWTKSASYAQGITVSDDGDIWTADNVKGTVTRYSNNGIFKATIIVGRTPSGVSVDNMGKIWAVDTNDEYIHRINPANNQTDGEGNIVNGVELSKRIVGGTHYGYSDMTGALSNTITTNHGSWDLIHDSGINNALWGVISWNAYIPNGTSVNVRVRSSNDKVNWSSWEEAINAEYLKSTPNGRYLEVETTLERFKGSVSPILYDLSVRVLKSDINIINGINNSVPKLGDTIKLVTVLTNNGPDSAHNITVVANIPVGFTPVTPTIGVFNGSVWTINTLIPGEIAILEVIGNITQNLTSKNITYSANETHNEYDSKTNPPATINFYVPFSDIKLDYSLKNGKPTLIVRNIGPDGAFNINIKTSIPKGYTPKTSGGTYKGGTWTITSIPSNGSFTMTLVPLRGNKTPSTSDPSSPGHHGSINNHHEVNQNSTQVNASSSSQTRKGSSVPMQQTGVPINFSAIAILFMFFAAYLNKNDNEIRPNKWLILFIVLFLALLCMGNVGAADTNYTSDDDFSKGTFNNVNGSDGSLKLANSSNAARNYIWIPNSNEGTISKVNVKTGQEVARYKTNPASNAEPVRIAVDSQGNCWAANRVTGSLIKIGLYENGVYDDRNHDGIIQTCHDVDKNGIITPDEVLNWGSDECVTLETIIIPGKEGVFHPGSYSGGYAAYGTGLTSLVLDNKDNVWLGIGENQTLMYINGSSGEFLKSYNVMAYGHSPSYAVIDKNNILWSGGSNLMRLDPSTGSISVTNLDYNIFNIAYDGDDHIFTYGVHPHFLWPDSRFSRINIENNTLDWTQLRPARMHTASMVLDENGDLWMAEYYKHWVYGKRTSFGVYSHNGTLKSNFISSISPLSLCFDSYGKLWVMDLDGEYIHRFDTSINGIELSKRLVSTNHNALGYFTVKSPDKYESGAWSVVHDYGSSTGWDNISWNSWEPVGTKVSVHVRSSNDQINWSNWEDAGNGLSIKMTPPGRYLQVEVNLERFNNTESPVLYDISFNPLNVTDEATDLAVSITGNASSVGIGDTVHLVISLSNLGPKACDAKLNYKIPVGLKLLSSQGPGAYDEVSGVWNAGLLLVNDTISLDLVLQATNIGYFVNIVSVYGDLTSTHAHAAKPIVKVFNGKWKSTAAMSDSNGGNNKASFSFDVKSPTYQTPSHEYKWPHLPDPTPTPQPQPTPTPKPDKEPQPQPTPKPKDPPKPTPSNDQLPRDIASVRDITGGVKDAKIADWTLDPFNDDNDTEASHVDVPDWAWALILGGAIIGCVLTITPAGTAASEYIQTIKLGILEALASLWIYSSYLGNSIKEFIINAMTPVFIKYGNFITPNLQEMLFTPITGIGPMNIISLGLRNLAVMVPALEPYIAPVIESLDQLTLIEVAQKLK